MAAGLGTWACDSISETPKISRRPRPDASGTGLGSALLRGGLREDPLAPPPRRSARFLGPNPKSREPEKLIAAGVALNGVGVYSPDRTRNSCAVGQTLTGDFRVW